MAKSDSVQISFVDDKTSKKPKSSSKKNMPKKSKNDKKEVKKETKKNNILITKSKKVIKKDRKKINVTQEDLDKICEVYDWYISVKEDVNKIKKTTKNINKKKLIIEENLVKEKKNATIVVDKEIWGNFDMLCKNAEFKKGEIITQALKDFILKHKDLY